MNVWQVKVTQLLQSGPYSGKIFVFAADKQTAKSKIVVYHNACGFPENSYRLSHFQRLVFGYYDVCAYIRS